ncbi:MAG: hypothetical protein ACSHX9_02005 [Luteolibacter sp.]
MSEGFTRFSDVSIVLRSAGERTAPLCKELLSSLVVDSGTQFHETQQAPFGKALHESFNWARSTPHKWTLTIDGDILPHTAGLRSLIEFAETLPSDIFHCQGLVIDKLFGNIRPAGVRIYRTSAIERMMEEITDNITDSIRPESNLVQLMKKLGYGSAEFSREVGGLHDHEQYFRDIYRKSFIHARKNAEYIRLLLPHWEALAESDPDFKIAMIGYRAGMAFPHDLPIDIRLLPTEISPILKCLGLVEKKEIPVSGLDESYISREIATFRPLPATGLLRRRLGYSEDDSPLTKLGEIREALGWRRVIPWLIGVKLRNFGRRLVIWAEDHTSLPKH